MSAHLLEYLAVKVFSGLVDWSLCCECSEGRVKHESSFVGFSLKPCQKSSLLETITLTVEQMTCSMSTHCTELAVVFDSMLASYSGSLTHKFATWPQAREIAYPKMEPGAIVAIAAEINDTLDSPGTQFELQSCNLCSMQLPHEETSPYQGRSKEASLGTNAQSSLPPTAALQGLFEETQGPEPRRKIAGGDLLPYSALHHADPPGLRACTHGDFIKVLSEIDNARFSLVVSRATVLALADPSHAMLDGSILRWRSSLAPASSQTPPEGSSDIAERQLTAMEQLGIKVATPVGIIIGQLLFGWLGDLLGRKRIYGVELLLMIVGTFGQTLAAPAYGISVVGVLIVWRVFGWGQLAVRCYKLNMLDDTSKLLKDVDQIWRIIIGLGCVPGAIALYFRLTIPETPRFTMDIERNVQKATQDVDAFLTPVNYTVDPEVAFQRLSARTASKQDFQSYFSKWENLKVLLGTSYSWFALDIAFYGLGLNSSIILDAIGFGSPQKGLTGAASIYENLTNTSLGNLILTVAGFIPGYWLAFIFIDRWGRKPIQLMGFAVLFVLLIVMGSAYEKLIATTRGRNVFVFLYCLANVFENFGPNTTTFIVPGEVFPTRYRSTAHGISAASGKIGAVVAQIAFQWMKDIGGSNAFIGHILQIFSFFMLTGLASTLLIPETSHKTLERLSNERQDGFFRHKDIHRRFSMRTLGDSFPMGTIRLAPLNSTVQEPDTAVVSGKGVHRTQSISWPVTTSLLSENTITA
ncbi:hypothetical protein POSPLADRAFT_1156131 [Postia placenta MAD-698-R-SB12]|uniref:Major facilitator superfamily (MFS) profile domain-containing protein n=1 Tax=Postia placenta MAD-698-R-SB12 TaxID=670580 RepID=A0A1X6MNJ5_9APHY|nr:hypothetical protein POSPLADRAFT_1156131 [Postia placenta MAD-698-R-SB12]OSX57806.1 hypothetical protein POSPLADRAFT_1156131 [Postia placenta MAD-698-R-SB12]